jgi:hypothetical protein
MARACSRVTDCLPNRLKVLLLSVEQLGNALEPRYHAGLFSDPVCAAGRYSLPGRWPTETGLRG